MSKLPVGSFVLDGDLWYNVYTLAIHIRWEVFRYA
jgi:hypothetical protein